ncbi:MAG: hypothetical protein KF832_22925 [Caldilineaceae bacterium]|nr:hypothetical protein [Caldilineaceae bacterium]
MNRHAAQWKLRKVLISLVTLVSIIISLCPAPAYAWKPSTHIYLAEEALKDALDDGKVTIHRVDYASGKILDKLGDYSVDAALLAALRAYPEQYRAGILGPDAYPDIVTGQRVIHPDVSHPSGSNSWLEYLWSAAANEGEAAKAFAAGYLTHASGDMFGHTFINNYTGGEFALGENAIKHIVLEGYVGKRTPPTVSSTGAVVTEANVNIAGIEDFIYRYLVDAKPGTTLNQQLLASSDGQLTMPYIFSTLRASLRQAIDGYYRKKADYDRRIDEKLQAARRCKWSDFSCSARLLEIQAGALSAEKLAYMVANGPGITYQEYWVDDIDDGLRAWPRVSHEVAKALVYNTGGSDLKRAQAVIDTYVKDHLISMAGAPDAVGGLLNLMDTVMRPLTFLREAIAELKKDLLKFLIKTATGIDIADVEKFFKTPEHHFDEVMGSGSAGEKTSLATFNAAVLRIADRGYQNPDERFDYHQLPAAYNTVTINKLILLSPSEINRLLADLGSPQKLQAPNVMLGFLRSLDGGNQWHEHEQKLVFALDCPTYRQLFMQQIGETGGCLLSTGSTDNSDNSDNSTMATVTGNSLISTVAGNGTADFSGDGGPATSATLDAPVGVEVDSASNLYIAVRYSDRIRKVDTNGVITTVAGNGTTDFSGDGGPATSAALNMPAGVVIDSTGNLYIADTGNNRIRKVDTNSIISTIAGNGTADFSGDGGPATSATLNNPAGVAIDSTGNLYIVDAWNNRIRKVDANGIISTIAGNGTADFSGDGGPATSATLNNPTGVAVDSAGNLYIADAWNNRVRKVDVNGVITTVAGNGILDFNNDEGPATSVSFYAPSDVAVDSAGNLYIADSGNSTIRKVDTNGIITTVAGNGEAGVSGDGEPAASVSLVGPVSVAVDSAGNLYIADNSTSTIRKVAP